MLNEKDQMKVCLAVGYMYSTLQQIKSYCESYTNTTIKNMATNGINFARDQLKDVDWNVTSNQTLKNKKNNKINRINEINRYDEDDDIEWFQK